jgi:hypothetical protein
VRIGVYKSPAVARTPTRVTYPCSSCPANRRDGIGRANLDDLARLHALPQDGQADLPGLQIDGDASLVFHDLRLRQFADGKQRLAAHEDVDQRSFLCANPAPDKHVISQTQGQ